MNDKTARPQDVVQQQLDAYNARDIEAFMACWADDAQYYEHPDTLLASGKAAIRERHLARFREPSLYGERIKRMAVGEYGGRSGGGDAQLPAGARQNGCHRHLRSGTGADRQSLVQDRPLRAGRRRALAAPYCNAITASISTHTAGENNALTAINEQAGSAPSK